MSPPETNARGSSGLIALHTIVAFLVTVSVNLVQINFQGKPESPFETRPLTTSLAVSSLLFYCLLALVGYLSLAPACCARAFPILMMLAATLSVASFTSLLFRRPFHSFPYLLSLVLVSMLLLSIFVHVFRPSQPANQPADQPLLPVVAPPFRNQQSVQVDRAPNVPPSAHHQHTTGNDFQICNRGSTDSGSSTFARDGDPTADLQPSAANRSVESLETAELDGEVGLEIAEDRAESEDGVKN